MYFRIRDCVDELFCGEEVESVGIDEVGLLNVLKEWGIVDDVMNMFKFEGFERDLGWLKDKRRVNVLEEVLVRGNSMLF